MERKARIDKTYCCVPFCNSRADKDPSLSFHKFPNDSLPGPIGERNAKRKMQWIHALRIGKKVSRHMPVCSRHFKKEDYILPDHPKQRHRLRIDAVPSLCLPLSSNTSDFKVKIEDEEFYNLIQENMDYVLDHEAEDSESASDVDSAPEDVEYVLGDIHSVPEDVEYASGVASEDIDSAPEDVESISNYIQSTSKGVGSTSKGVEFASKKFKSESVDVRPRIANFAVPSEEKKKLDDLKPKKIYPRKKIDKESIEEELNEYLKRRYLNEEKRLAFEREQQRNRRPPKEKNTPLTIRINSDNSATYDYAFDTRTIETLSQFPSVQPVCVVSDKITPESSSKIHQVLQLQPLKAQNVCRLVTDSDYDAFAKKVVSELKQMKDPVSRAKAVFSIQRVLFESKLGVFDDNEEA